MKVIITTIILLTVISGCKNNRSSSGPDAEPDDLITGEFKLDDTAFGETIELIGTNISTDAIFTPIESQLAVSDSILILKNSAQANTHIIHILELPDLKSIGKIGSPGRGPFEFLFPQLVKSTDTSAITYIHELTTGKMYKLTKKYSLQEVYSPFKPLLGSVENGIVNISTDEYLYVDISLNETRIGRIKHENTINQNNKTDILDISFNPQVKMHQAYQGNLCANSSKNRLVYTYRYYKRVVFSDIYGENIRTILFPGKEYDVRTYEVPDGADLNVTHYYDAIAGDEYVYLKYSGREPRYVREEIEKGVYYMYLEQWDWNGNPLKRYQLDQQGAIAIDEKNGKIYLVAYNHEHPFFVYDLPEL